MKEVTKREQAAAQVSEMALHPWSEDDLPLLEKLLGDPAMTMHLGGPESPEQIAQRHQRYLNLPEDV